MLHPGDISDEVYVKRAPMRALLFKISVQQG
jgi:hypothetical protein